MEEPSSSFVNDIFAPFLDGYEDIVLATASEESQVTVVEQQSRKRRRRRPKDELEALHGAVLELKERLASLRIPREGAASDWMEVARRQKRHLQQALDTNAQLVVLVAEKRRLANDFQKVLLKHFALTVGMFRLEYGGVSRSLTCLTLRRIPRDPIYLLLCDQHLQ